MLDYIRHVLDHLLLFADYIISIRRLQILLKNISGQYFRPGIFVCYLCYLCYFAISASFFLIESQSSDTVSVTELVSCERAERFEI